MLGCSSVLTRDLPSARSDAAPLWRYKFTTALVVLVALIWALIGRGSVFGIVIFSWSGLASALGPLLILRALAVPVTFRNGALAVVIGVSVAIVWRLAGLHDGIYEGMPGILAGLAAGWLARPQGGFSTVPRA